MFGGLSGWHLIILFVVVVVVVVVVIVVTASASNRRRTAQPQGGVGPDGYPLSTRTNTMAILSLIFAFFISLLAVVFGHVALAQIRRTGEQGRGLAVAGLVLGYLSIAAAVIGVIIWIVMFTQLAHYGSAYGG
ncbi:DUF4190 domain-containing protein [Microbacterium capsulatum]|uniref:DUF4190 domain-containing protein n=1 Tax=Microbacterium capsulatum TaxID=3041921 RepID=A0ABU0XED7_9MICO|nr:DUF4190 domain-containing protein [Microbacterium sp. ASV81]MDQ4213448.1 DUF4190 domain-containing protein [Microbacterium sp. ASV81]